MFFPIGDDQVKGGSYPSVSYTFIIVNIAVYFLQLSNMAFTYGYSTIPYEIMNGVDLVSITQDIPQYQGPRPIYLTLLFSMFMHGGWRHLIGNLLFLWVFGDNIESTIGSVKFAVFYILGGLVASAGHIAFNVHSVIPSLGASGAIAAVMGAYLIMFPSSKVKVLVLIFFRTFKIPAFIFLGIWIILNLYSGVGSFMAQSSTGTAWWSHISGFAFGVAAGYFFKNLTAQVVLEGQEYHSVENEPTRYNNRHITDRYKNY